MNGPRKEDTVTETPWTPGPWEVIEPGPGYAPLVHAPDPISGSRVVAAVVGARAKEHARLIAAAPELVAALEELASCEELDLSMYGSFPGGDPRCFEPDEEVTTPEEIANWREACEAWNRGEGVDRGPSCQTLGDGSAVTGTGYGMGVFRWQHPAAASARALLARVRGEEIQG